LADLRANKSRWVITACLPGTPLIFNGFEKIEWQPVNLFSYSQINWEGDKDLKKFITRVNRIRRSSIALQEGKYVYVPSNQGLADNTQLFCFARVHDEEKMLVVVNMDVVNMVDSATVYLPDEFNLDYSRPYFLRDNLNRKTYVREGKELIVILEPGESHIFEVMQDAS